MSASDQADPAVAAAEAELARLRAEADVAEAQLKAAQARAALAAAEARRCCLPIPHRLAPGKRHIRRIRLLRTIPRRILLNSPNRLIW